MQHEHVNEVVLPPEDPTVYVAGGDDTKRPSIRPKEQGQFGTISHKEYIGVIEEPLFSNVSRR